MTASAAGARIRVLHVIKTLHLGGAEVNLLNLVGAFNPQTVETHVAYAMGGEVESRLRSEHAAIFKYDDGSHRIRSWATWRIVARLAAYIRRHRIQIVHSHNFNAHVWGLLAAKWAGARVIEHVHDFRYLDREDFVRRRGTDTLYPYAALFRGASDRVVVLTQQNFQYLTDRRWYPAERVRRIPNGIALPPPPRDGRSIRERLGIPNGAPIILTPVRIHPSKNLDLILRVAPEVAAQCPGTIFLICGDGEQLASLREQAARQGLENTTRFIGYYGDVLELLSASQVMLLPSLLELHSIAILEAMSMRTPVVASRGVGCNNEFIRDWENGVLLDPFRQEGWAAALVRLLKDPTLRRQIGDQGYQTCVEQFDVRRTAGRMEELYRELSA